MKLIAALSAQIYRKTLNLSGSKWIKRACDGFAATFDDERHAADRLTTVIPDLQSS